MNFVELPDHINCSFIGTFSPVLVRFEGGNGKGGFCIEEYHDRPPMVRIYGDHDDAKSQIRERLINVNLYLNLVCEGEKPVAQRLRSETWHATSLPRDAWFTFDVRTRTSLNFGIDGKHFAIIPSMDLDNSCLEEARHAYRRLISLYQRFYNA